MKNEFNDKAKEYIIRDMYPVRPWLNYAWNNKYISSFDQFGFGISRYTDSNGFIKNILTENDNRLVFIKNNLTGEYYAANRNYDDLNFDVFETVVGQGYSKIVSLYKGIKTEFTLFVTADDCGECWDVNVENLSGEEMDLSIYVYANIDAALTPIEGQTKVSYLDDINCINAAHEGCKVKVDHMVNTELTNMFFAAKEKPVSFETSNRRFKGIYSQISHPDGIKKETLSSELTCVESKIAAVFQYKQLFAKGEKKNYRFMLGAAKDIEDVRGLCNEILCESGFENSFKLTQQRINDFQKNISVETPDDDINSRVNIWLKRQIEIGKQWGRLYGKGFRDVMQDTMAFLALNPKDARDRILYSLKYQREDGNPVRQWEPFIADVYADGGAWLILTVNAYLKETADFEILDEKVGYFESEVEETVLQHCERAINYLQNTLGEHSLCLWRYGDWNDSLNTCGILGKGESVWLSMATYKAANEFIEILNRIGKTDNVSLISQKAEKMKENILKYGWDRDHFIYGINDFGEKIGSYEMEEGKLFLNPQTWAILAKLVDEKTSKELMELVEKELGCPYGYVQQKPAYSKGTDKIGRQSYIEVGTYENGGVYNHGVAFKAVADCAVGDGDGAYDTLKRIMPTNSCNLSSGVEAYMMSNMYFGPENKTRKGDSPQSWITGTGGWVFRCVVENIIGLQTEYDGLAIRPVLPTEWDNVKVKRVFRNCTYDITIKKTNQGEMKIIVDGEEINGSILPVFEGGEHSVLVTL